MKNKKLNNDDIERITRMFLENALGRSDSTLSYIRSRNLRFYHAEPSGELAPPEVLDRSTFVATDVSDTVDGMLPQLIDFFVSDKNAVEAVAKKPRASQQPPQEGQPAQKDDTAKNVTAYLNHLFYTRNNGLAVLHDAIQDALIQRKGVIKVWAEEEYEDDQQTYEGQTEEQIAMLLQDGFEIVGEPEQDDTGITVTVKKSGEQGMAFKVAAVPPHEMRYDNNARWGGECKAIGQVCKRRGFELEEMGYDLTDLTPCSVQENIEAYEMLGDLSNDEPSDFHDSHRLYDYAEAFIQIDADGDGVAEWLKVCLVGNKYVSHDKTDGHPFAEIDLMPLAHNYFGLCPADRAVPVMLGRTNLMRGMMDNIALSVDQRTYVNTEAGVEVDDLLDSRPGGVIRGNRPMQEAIGIMQQPSIPSQAWQLEEFLQVQRENGTGFTRYSQGSNGDSLNKTATGINIITQKSDMRVKLMARFVGDGLKTVMLKLLKLATKHQNQQDWYEVNGEFVAVNPTEWRNQYNIRVNVGLGSGTKEQLAARVMAMVPMQQAGQAVGVVRPEHVANTIRLYAQANEFQNPNDFCDEKPSGLPSAQEFEAMKTQIDKQMQDMQAQLQAAGQENAQLKAQIEDKQTEYSFKDRELSMKEADTAMKVQSTTQLHSEKSQAIGDYANSLADSANQVAMAAATIAPVLEPKIRRGQMVSPSGTVFYMETVEVPNGDGTTTKTGSIQAPSGTYEMESMEQPYEQPYDNKDLNDGN